MPQAKAPVSPCPLRPAGHRWLLAPDRSTASNGVVVPPGSSRERSQRIP